MITLKPIDKSNWEACISLCVKPEQSEFVASNLYSIAEAQFLNGFSSMAIYSNQTLVGYALFGIDPDDHNYWIYRMMIDQHLQGHGYGLAAVRWIIDEIRNREDRTDAVLLGYNPDNEEARRLYARAGFKEEGMAPWGEMIAKYYL